MSVRPVIIAPSILSADFVRLADEISAVEAAGADFLHVDVMDGHFVPNLTIGPPIVESLRNVTSLPFDVHLMIRYPDAFIPEFAKAGANYLTVHTETCPHLHRTIQLIKTHGVKAGIALNPSTSVTSLEDVIVDADLVLIMSVNPGFGGQEFIPATFGKITRTRDLITRTGSQALLAVDGGIKVENAAEVIKAGAEVLVAGSAIFNSPNYADTIQAFRSATPPVSVSL